MSFENEPEPDRANDFDVPGGVRPLLWLVSKVTPVSADADMPHWIA